MGGSCFGDRNSDNHEAVVRNQEKSYSNGGQGKLPPNNYPQNYPSNPYPKGQMIKPQKTSGSRGPDLKPVSSQIPPIIFPQTKTQDKSIKIENEKNSARNKEISKIKRPKSLTNFGNICYMLSTLQCVSACLYYFPKEFENNPAGQLFSSLINSGDGNEHLKTFLKAYKSKFSDFKIGEERDTKEFFLRLIEMLGTTISSYFITKKSLTVTCLGKQHTTAVEDLTAFYDFGALENFEEVYKNYFSHATQEKTQYCMACEQPRRCKVDDIYILPPIMVFYFSNSTHVITIDALAYKLSQKRLKLIGIIKRIGNMPDTGHYVAYVLIDENWYICNDSHIANASKEERLEPYLVFSKQES